MADPCTGGTRSVLHVRPEEAALSAPPGVGRAPAPRPTASTIIDILPRAVNRWLNEFGAEGWGVIAVSPWRGDRNEQESSAVLKREVSPNPGPPTAALSAARSR